MTLRSRSKVSSSARERLVTLLTLFFFFWFSSLLATHFARTPQNQATDPVTAAVIKLTMLFQALASPPTISLPIKSLSRPVHPQRLANCLKKALPALPTGPSIPYRSRNFSTQRSVWVRPL